MGGPGSGRKPTHPPAAAKSTTRTTTPSISARSDSDDSGDEGEPFHWGTCVVATTGPLAASHALVTHAKSNRSYGVRLLLRKPRVRYASIPASSLSSHSLDVDIRKDSVRAYRAYLAIQSRTPTPLPPITFAPSLPVSFAGSTYAPSDWHEAWARWDSAWLRALVAQMPPTNSDATPAYVVMWDAKHLTDHFPPHDVSIEHTDACNDRLRLHHARASAAFAPLSPDPTTALSVDPAATPLCAICSAPAVAYSDGPWFSAHTVTAEDTSSSVSTDRSSTTLSVDSPRSTTTTTTDTLTETTTTTTISTTTTTTTKTTKTTRTARSAYPRGLRPDLHALYDACARACPAGLAGCSTPTCRLALCIPCFVAHFPFDAHCDLLPISRAAHSHWQCPRCDHIPPPRRAPLPARVSVSRLSHSDFGPWAGGISAMCGVFPFLG